MAKEEANATLASSEVTSQVEQSQGSEANQQATQTDSTTQKPAFDPEKFKTEILDAARAVATQQAETERRRIQGQADAKIAEISRVTQQQIEATRKAMMEALKEHVSDEDVIARVEAQLPVRQKATLYDLSQQEQGNRARSAQLEQQAIAMAAGLGLKREDFNENEWGGGMPIDQWYQSVAVPKAIARAKDEAVKVKVAQVQAEQTHAQQQAVAGVTATEISGGGLPERKPKPTLEDAGDLGDVINKRYKYKF